MNPAKKACKYVIPRNREEKMLADLYCTQAIMLNKKAVHYGKAALALEPNSKFDLNTINNSWGGNDYSDIYDRVIEQIGDIPDINSSFTYKELTVTVTEVEDQRVNCVILVYDRLKKENEKE